MSFWLSKRLYVKLLAKKISRGLLDTEPSGPASSMQLSRDVKKDTGQHFVFGFHGKSINDEIRSLICDYHIGHFILMKRNVQDALQTKQLIYDLQRLAKDAGHDRPLLIGTDQENGLVSPTAGTQYPGAMSLAATGSIEIAENIAAASGKELAAVGIHWAYSPVADVNSNSRNPVIGVRSFGDDPEEVSRYVQAVSRGMVNSDVASCAKHFPGHGDTHVDSHLALPVIPKSLQELHQTEFVPFKAFIASGAPSIMTAHVALPNVTGDLIPSSMSREITTDLLRKELGYEGVVVTDCLEMDAVMKEYGTERAAVESLKAGADIAMICHTLGKQIGAVKLTWEAYQTGEIDANEFRASGERINQFKDRFAGHWDDFTNPILALEFNTSWLSLLAGNQRLSHEAYQNSVAIISNLSNIIPLGKEEDVVLFTPEMESLNRAVDDAEDVVRTAAGYLRNTAGASYLAFATSVARRARSRHVVYTKSPYNNNLQSASAIIFTLRNADRSTWQIDYLKALLDEVSLLNATSGIARKIVLLASCTPYDLLGIKGISLSEIAYVASFEFTALALETVTEVIFGEVEAKGRIPVLGERVIG